MIEERRIIECKLSIERRAAPAPMHAPGCSALTGGACDCGAADEMMSTLVGYPAVFGKKSVDLGGFTEEVARGAFSKSLISDDVIATVEHDPAMILGRSSARTLRLSEDPTGLRMEIDLPDTSAGRDISVSVQRGDVKGASFKFRTITDSWEMLDGLSHRTLIEAKLLDVCPVANPAYPDTSIAMRSLEQWKLANAPINTIGLFLRRQRQAESFGR